ncbi:MAG: hypothetical protein WAM70_00865 [Pyrinomonadaceae bacterium]
MYDVPGRADNVSPAVQQAWNDLIQARYNATKTSHPGPFLQPTPDAIANGQTINAVRWPANPLVPLACLDQDEELTRKLCDFGVRGRHVLHNEYLEYMVVHRQDANGNSRPKRVIMTTELREYWTTLAVHDPDFCRALIEGLIGRAVQWSELYGSGVTDPTPLSQDSRLRRFSREVAGSGASVSGVPDQPVGKLNRENILFMTHPINGLDDLIFIVMFGAKPFAVRLPDGSFREPTKFEIFGNGNPLACRNADPAAATGASAQARRGKKIAFANPLGMYILSDQNALRGLFFVDNDNIPAEWIRLSRGRPGMFQRLEFGPGDDSPKFLDDIIVATGADDTPVKGGYDVAKKIEVGPLLTLEQQPSVNPVVHEEVSAIPANQQFRCSESNECADVRALLEEFEGANA